MDGHLAPFTFSLQKLPFGAHYMQNLLALYFIFSHNARKHRITLYLLNFTTIIFFFFIILFSLKIFNFCFEILVHIYPEKATKTHRLNTIWGCISESLVSQRPQAAYLRRWMRRGSSHSFGVHKRIWAAKGLQLYQWFGNVASKRVQHVAWTHSICLALFMHKHLVMLATF